jgi:hyperosmotically inducible periplasmic protein
MKKLTLSLGTLTLLASGILAGCSGASAKSPDVASMIRRSLDEAGFTAVAVNQNRDGGIVTLSGRAPNYSDKSQAGTIAKALAGAQIVANQIAVIPSSLETDAKNGNPDLDRGIEENLNTELIQHKLHYGVRYDVEAGVITLTGAVNSERDRTRAQKVATGIPYVQRVVNDLEIKNQKASSSR